MTSSTGCYLFKMKNYTHLKLSINNCKMILVLFLCFGLAKTQPQQQQQPYPEFYGQASESNDHSLPGHYAFEVAAYLEPPLVRKPPYKLALEACSGLASDSLCGDLSAGYIPQNPLQQEFADGEPYPFELIKNKTLLFLARALPILQTEYETIPKVARFAPPSNERVHQLLNPTLPNSLLSSAHMNHLNSHIALGLSPEFAESVAPLFVSSQSKRRRRKRSSSSMSLDLSLDDQNPMVLMSAHSAPSYQLATTTSLPQALKQHQNESQARGTSQRSQRGDIVVANEFGKFRLQANGETAPTSTEQQQQVSTNKRSGLLASASNLQLHQANGSPDIHARSVVYSTKLRPSNNNSNNNSNSNDLEKIAAPAMSANNKQMQQQKSPCADLGGLYSFVCQATWSLIDGSQAPTWIQIAKQLISHNLAATSANSVDSGSPSSALSAIASAFVQEPAVVVKKDSTSSLPNDQSPVVSLKQSVIGGFQAISSLLSSTSSLLSQQNKQNFDRSDRSQANYVTKKTGSLTNPTSKLKSKHSTTTSMSNFNFAKYLASFVVGLASSPITKFAESFLPTTPAISRSSLIPSAPIDAELRSLSFSRARNKKPFDNLITSSNSADDSLLSLATGNNIITNKQAAAPAPTAAASFNQLKAPPTPCKSVEEYISPTFARNYQGYWRYVVQIPHEGYFTQTIQKTACVKQKCEFMEGVCHEAPRWVSLLVAEVFYPNAIFSSSSTNDPIVAAQIAAAAAAVAVPTGTGTGSPANMDMAHQATQASAHHRHHQVLSQSSPSPTLLQAALMPQAQTQTQTQTQQIQRYPSQQPAQPVIYNKPPGISHSDPLQMTDSLQNYEFQLKNAFAQANLANELVDAAGMRQVAYNIIQQQQSQKRSDDDKQGKQQKIIQQAAHQTKPTDNLSQHPLVFMPNSDPWTSFLNSLALQQHNPYLSYNDLISAAAAAYNYELNNHKQQHQQLRKKRQLASSAQSVNNNLPQQQTHFMPSHTSLAQELPGQVSTSPINRRDTPHSSLPVIRANDNIVGLTHIDNSISDAQANNKLTNQQQQQQHQLQTSQSQTQVPNASLSTIPHQSTATTPTLSLPVTASSSQEQQQTDCDGYDKIGCYNIRVYYDWFLVNGSCKCWKNSPLSLNPNSNTQTSPTTSNSLLRRIFVG